MGDFHCPCIRRFAAEGTNNTWKKILMMATIHDNGSWNYGIMKK
jgi:hypothetical protein